LPFTPVPVVAQNLCERGDRWLMLIGKTESWRLAGKLNHPLAWR
jgi:hypothetical protein